MNKKSELEAKRTTTLQILIALVLIGLPVVMIYVNGKDALKSILWNNNNSVSTTDSSGRLMFGVYDPNAVFIQQQGLALEQVYFSWANFNDQELLYKLATIKNRKRTPVLTIEPWEIRGRKKELLPDIISGKYDSILALISNLLNQFDAPIFISWGHEMDQDLTERYSWSSSEPDTFIQAYQYVHDKIEKTVAQNIHWIWAPVVKSGTERFWPGDAYVDWIGIPVYGYPAWEKSYYGHTKTFNDWYAEKYAMIKKYNKLVIITELGVTGDYKYRSAWLKDAFTTIKKSPEVKAVIFFNAQDTPGVWGKDVATPDWRIEPELMTFLINSDDTGK